MSIGQVLELHFGMAAREMGIKIATPVFDGAMKKMSGKQHVWLER